VTITQVRPTPAPVPEPTSLALFRCRPRQSVLSTQSDGGLSASSLHAPSSLMDGSASSTHDPERFKITRSARIWQLGVAPNIRMHALGPSFDSSAVCRHCARWVFLAFTHATQIAASHAGACCRISYLNVVFSKENRKTSNPARQARVSCNPCVQRAVPVGPRANRN
jgi:hypothetical protein